MVMKLESITGIGNPTCSIMLSQRPKTETGMGGKELDWHERERATRTALGGQPASAA